MMEIVTKDYPVTAGDASDEYPNGSFEVILSAPTEDRDGEIVDSKAFEPLPEHITFDTDHSMTCDSVVGSGVPAYADDGTLRVKGGYASDERSQVIRQKVAEGHIRTTSVTFMAAERKPDSKGIPHVIKAELLNGTFTPVPSNRESVVLTAKSIVAHATAEKVGARNSSTDAEMIQGIHDSSASLGADCSGAKGISASATLANVTYLRDLAGVPEGTKSIIGSLEAIRDRVNDAITDAYPYKYTYIRGVLPTYVVFDVYAQDSNECETFQQDYTDDGSVVTLTGLPVEVDVQEVVTPDADASTEPVEGVKSADTAADTAAAQATAESTAESTDDDLREQALKSINENAARFAFDG